MALFELGTGDIPLVIARNQVGKLAYGALSPQRLGTCFWLNQIDYVKEDSGKHECKDLDYT